MRKKFQVFIPSTFIDLKLERQACVEAILRAGRIPAGMELFSAGSETQLQVIKRRIEDSDVYMLLLGGRYGSLEQSSGLSYTEIEYRYAQEIGKPTFAIVMSEDLLNEKVKNEGTQIIELANRQKFENFKQLVLSKTSRFYNNDNEIKLAILESLIDIQSRTELVGWVKANEIIDVRNFTDQIKSLTDKNRELEEKLQDVGINTTERVGDFSYDEIKAILDNITVTVPGRFRQDKQDLDCKLTDLFISQREAFAVGFSSDYYSRESNVIFLIERIVPYLRIYDLVESVKFGQHNKIIYQSTKSGNRFIALYLKKQELPKGPFYYVIQ